jgi:opacity protein-like surface antigen
MKSLTIVALAAAAVACALASPALAQEAAVPEIDPNLVQTGLTVLVGGVLVLIGGRRRK